MSPFVMGCVDAFRNAYAQTGMNIVQSMVVFAVAIGQQGWRKARAGSEGRRPGGPRHD